VPSLTKQPIEPPQSIVSFNFCIKEEFKAEAEAQETQQPPGHRSISPTQQTQASPQSSFDTGRSNPTFLLTAAASVAHNKAAATTTMQDQDTNNNSGDSNTNNTEDPPPPPQLAAATANVANNNKTVDVTEPPTFEALTNWAWWRRSPFFARSDALALLPTLDDNNQYNAIFSDLMGDELQNLVPHAIELIQGILSIADHDWKVSEQSPSTTDLSALPGMYHLIPHHQELLDLHLDRKYKLPIQHTGAGDGGAGDKGSDDERGDDSEHDEEEDDTDPYDTDKTDKVYDVTPQSSDQVNGIKQY
jgi:hypothetical protein